MIDRIGFALFERAMAADPVARPPARRPRFGAREWLAALANREAPVFSESAFLLRPNGGGGDCLFHALAGSDIGGDNIRAMRRRIAAVRMAMAPAPRANARRVIAALLQTPETRAFGVKLADRGLAAVGNGTIAALQSVPGIHAGEAEIGQYCAAHDESVLVLDSRGWLCSIGKSGVRRCRPDAAAGRKQVERALGRGRTVLFKADGHWRRILAVARSA